MKMLQYCHITYPHFLFLVHCQLVAICRPWLEQHWTEARVGLQPGITGHSLNQTDYLVDKLLRLHFFTITCTFPQLKVNTLIHPWVLEWYQFAKTQASSLEVIGLARSKDSKMETHWVNLNTGTDPTAVLGELDRTRTGSQGTGGLEWEAWPKLLCWWFSLGQGDQRA